MEFKPWIILLINIWIVSSRRCPSENIIYPCKCSENYNNINNDWILPFIYVSLFVDYPNLTFNYVEDKIEYKDVKNLTEMFKLVSENSVDNEKHFKVLIVGDIQLYNLNIIFK